LGAPPPAPLAQLLHRVTLVFWAMLCFQLLQLLQFLQLLQLLVTEGTTLAPLVLLLSPPVAPMGSI